MGVSARLDPIQCACGIFLAPLVHTLVLGVGRIYRLRSFYHFDHCKRMAWGRKTKIVEIIRDIASDTSFVAPAPTSLRIILSIWKLYSFGCRAVVGGEIMLNTCRRRSKSKMASTAKAEASNLPGKKRHNLLSSKLLLRHHPSHFRFNTPISSGSEKAGQIMCHPCVVLHRSIGPLHIRAIRAIMITCASMI